MYSAQDRYPNYVPSAGACKDGTGGHTPCKQWFIRITNEATLPEPDRPEVFFSGNLHGDEDVGPMTLITMVRGSIRTGGPLRRPTHMLALTRGCNARMSRACPRRRSSSLTREPPTRTRG